MATVSGPKRSRNANNPVKKQMRPISCKRAFTVSAYINRPTRQTNSETKIIMILNLSFKTVSVQRDASKKPNNPAAPKSRAARGSARTPRSPKGLVL